jgi:hypothetical protein
MYKEGDGDEGLSRSQEGSKEAEVPVVALVDA